MVRKRPRVIMLEDSYPDRKRMKELLMKRGIRVLTIREAVDHYQIMCKLDNQKNRRKND